MLLDIPYKAFKTNDGLMRTVGDSPLTLRNIGFAESDINRSHAVLISVYTQAVLWYCDGTVPRVANNRGHLLLPNDTLLLRDNAKLRRFRVVSAFSTATLAITLME